VLFCHVTSLVATDKHQELLERKGGQGFPHIVFLDSSGNVLAVHEDERDAEAFAKTGEKAKGFLALRARAEKGDKAAQVEYALAQVELGQIKVAEGKERLKGRRLTKEQQAKLDGLASTAEVRKILENVTQVQETQFAAARKFVEMKKAGKPAPLDDDNFQTYWILMMNLAEKEKNTALFEECLAGLKVRFGEDPEAADFFRSKAAILKKLKEEGGR